MRILILCSVVLVSSGGAVRAQGAADRAPQLAGVWHAATPDGPQEIVVRPDSTATFGQDTVRWRLSADTIFIRFGDEWVGYNFVLRGDTLTLSGGDLEEPVTLRRVGSPPRPRERRDHVRR